MNLSNVARLSCLTLLLSAALAAQGPPTESCTFEWFGKNPKLATVVSGGGAEGYFACSGPDGCLHQTIAQGEPIIVYRTKDKWTCGYHTGAGGAAPVWIYSESIGEVKAEANPDVTEWQGVWKNAEDQIAITLGNGELQLKGTAKTNGGLLGTVVHEGSFSGTAKPTSNHVHVGQGSCAVELTLIGKYLVTDDNNNCGGMNVRFAGVWTREGK